MLETLRIVDSKDYHGTGPESGDTLGSLREMMSVCEIRISLEGFHTDSGERPQDHAHLRDNLSPNINYLRVYVENCTKWDDPYEFQWGEDSLGVLAQDCRASYPYLGAIIVFGKSIGVLPIDEDVRKLKAQFKEQGVSFSFKGEHLATPTPALQK
jgi:hypothetical protein